MAYLANSAKVATEERDRILKYGSWSAEAAGFEADQYQSIANSQGLASALFTSGSLLSGVSEIYEKGDPNKFLS